MRFLAAIAFLLLGVAYAHHSVEHQLKYPQFHVGFTQSYDVAINMTAGVPGLSPQVSKAVIFGELEFYAKTETDLAFRFVEVEVAGSLPSVPSNDEPYGYEEQQSLKRELNVPIYVKYENGKVIKYSEITKESLVAQKIRRSVLRSLQLYIDEKYIGSTSQGWPIVYNLTRDSPAGKYKSHYSVTVSPYIEFPANVNVYNISRFDNFEGISYIGYKTHHNFDKQGCPEVCKKEHTENRFKSGCPTGQEPHHGLIKRSFTQDHNLKLSTRRGKTILVFDYVYTKETHLADVFDQDLEVTVESVLKRDNAESERSFEVDPNQEVKTDLDDLPSEVQEEAWESLCKYPQIKFIINEAKKLLNETVTIIMEDNPQSEQSKEVGKNILAIQKYMQQFKHGDFRTFRQFIKSYHELEYADVREKLKRQIWLDILPTVGTEESVSFIVTHIYENINLDVRGISFWESKSLLEALPLNIHKPSDKTISELTRLLDVKIQKTTGYTMFYSAAHMAVARVIRKLCAYPLPEQQEEDIKSSQDRHSLRNMWKPLSQSEPLKKSNGVFDMYLQCPEKAANRFIERVTGLLLSTKDKAKRVIYIEALSLTGLPQVLPTLRKYVHSDPHDSVYSGLTRSFVDYLKTSTIFTLHNLAGRSPREVQDILLPVFFNVSAHPKVRNSAFSVIVKSQPTLALLEQIAVQSWKEPSEEVASYVTSTFETFGNSSQPCYQNLAQRFRKVYPQLKKYDGGMMKAKNILLDVFDEITGYGVEKRYDYIPSNESFIPSIFYSSIGYNVGSLKDYVCQVSANVQGITSRNIIDEVFKRLSLSAPADIPKASEEDIFKNLRVAPRDSEPWKAIFYQKIFYSHSYYYFDGDNFTKQDLLKIFLDLFTHYVKKEGSTITGHFVKLYIPTSFHSKSIAKTLPFPVQFEMRSPLLLSLKFEVKTNDKSVLHHELDVQPSIYQSHIYTNEILNLVDCKRVGVYYEQKTAFSYPFTSTISVKGGNFTFAYKMSDLPKTILSHKSEAGTYAGKEYLVPLPPVEDRRIIKTRPAQFKYPLSFGYFGMPKFVGEVLTEDIQYGLDPLPQNWEESTLYIHKLYMNSGWRRRSIEIRRVPEIVKGQSSDQIEYQLNYWRDYKYTSTEGSEATWSEGLKFDDELTETDTTTYADEGRKIYEKLVTDLSYIKDNVNFTVVHKAGSLLIKKSDFQLEYYHTFGGYLHLVHMNASSVLPEYLKTVVTADYTVGYINMPNEFKYNEKYGEQKGISIGAIAFCKTTPFLNPSIVTKTVFNYKPVEEELSLDKQVTLEPDTNEQCLEDKRSGAAHSPACIKAIREKSIYNHLKLKTVWQEDIPHVVREWGNYIDLAMKKAYFPHVNVSKTPYGPDREVNYLSLEALYIDKMTDEPVINIRLQKPSESVNYTMISAGNLRPLSSIETASETYALDNSNNTYLATCSLTGKYVKTYDMKLYPMASHACTYTLTTHCTEYKKFAVLVKYSSPKVTEIQIYFGEDKIVLKPGSESSYPVKYNDQQLTIGTLQYALLNESARISAQVFLTSDGSSYVQIYAARAGVKVYYDGQYVKVQVNPRYKGELCGLCSEYNGEVAREFRGPDRCLYLTAEGFAKSSIVGRCGGKTTNEPRICDNEEIQVHWARRHGDSEEDDREGYEPVTKRNVVTSRGSKLCFSTKPVPVCENNVQPKMTEMRQVNFHCLPKQDVHARKMVTESKRRILGELETKAVDYSDSIEVPKMC